MLFSKIKTFTLVAFAACVAASDPQRRHCDIDRIVLQYGRDGRDLDGGDGFDGRDNSITLRNGMPPIPFRSTPATIEAVMNFRSDCDVDSVRFELDGPRGFDEQQTEKEKPYYLFGNNGWQVPRKVFPVGEYRLTVTPSGDYSKKQTISFKIGDNKRSCKIVGYTVKYVNRDDGGHHRGLRSDYGGDIQLHEGMKLPFNPNPLNIEAITEKSWDCVVNSVYFELDAKNFAKQTQTETEWPYYLFGNDGRDIGGKVLDPNWYTLTAVVNNDKWTTNTIHFSIEGRSGGGSGGGH